MFTDFLYHVIYVTPFINTKWEVKIFKLFSPRTNSLILFELKDLII